MPKRFAIAALLAAFVLIFTGCNQEIKPDFKIVPSESSVQVHQGDSESVGIGIVPYGNFKGEVTISAKLANGSDLPSGINLSPTSVTVSGGRLDFSLTVSASSTAPVGDYNVSLTFASGKISHSIGFGIQVVPPAGSLDTSFGSNGVAVVKDLTQTQGENDVAYSLAFGNGGAIYVLGRSNDKLVVCKLDDSGKFDNSFAGNTGAAVLGDLRALSSDTLEFDFDHTLAVTLGGKLMVAGYSYNGNDDDLLLARLNPDGSLDTGFGGSGIITYDNLAGGGGNVNDRGYSMLPVKDGFLVGGMGFKDTSVTEQFVIARFKSNGDLDKVVSDGKQKYDALYSLAAGSSSYMGGGETIDASGNRKGLFASADAELNLGNWGGLTAFSDGSVGGRVRSVTPSNDGGFYLAGYVYNGNDYDLVIEKLKADGAPDENFGTGGTVVLDKVAGGTAASSDRAFSVITDQEGRIVVAGRSFFSGQGDNLIVVRLKPDGSLDEKFGTSGVFVYDGGNGANGNDGAFEVALDPYGRIVVVGYTTSSDGDQDLLALRLNP